jgi:tryptophanyl-tRNA synthetase
MSQLKQRVLTGLRTSGWPHLGNYFGAIKPAIDFQKQHELFLFIADLHALNSDDTPEKITDQSLDLAATLIASGLDLNKGCFYAQSGVPEVCELAWILGCQAPYGMMLRAHSFKDAQAKGIEVNMGVFNYPTLMAADILLYDATLVPVGQDQKQHLEMTRDIAQRFNSRYGQTFVVPEPVISENVAVVPGTDGEKMSKSKGNVVPVFATDKDWQKAIMSIKTDSKGVDESKDPEACNVFKLYKLVAASDSDVATMAGKYRAGGYGYGHAKQDLLAAVKARFTPMRDSYDQLRKNPDQLRRLLVQGSDKARVVAEEKLVQVRKAVGLVGKTR